MHLTNQLQVMSVGEKLAALSFDCCIRPHELSSLQSGASHRHPWVP
jgi:hypothetical protein